MSVWKFIRHSLLHYWRIHCAVALGVAAATAVLGGAILVGESVRESLRQVTLDRLGRIDAALVANRFFSPRVVTDLQRADGFSSIMTSAVPAIIFPRAAVECSHAGRVRRASRVLVVGCDHRFWQLGTSPVRPDPLPGPEEIVLNEPLAADLGAKVGDQVVLRLPKTAAIPAESPLGQKQNRIRGIPRLRVIGIVAAEGLGRFDLTASQNATRNAFVAFETLQQPLQQPGKINAILASGPPDRPPAGPEPCRRLSKLAAPSLADYGLSIRHVGLAYQERPDGPEQTVLDYFNVTSDRMVMDPQTEKVVLAAFAADGAQPVLTYLANAIIRIDRAGAGGPQTAGPEADRGIPYSTVAAVDSVPGLGPLLDDSGRPVRLGDGQIVLNRWAAEDLGANPGDTIRLVYFQPETTHGLPRETQTDLTLEAITPLTEPARPFGRNRSAVYDQRPTLANDSHLTPEVRGITDQRSISRWEVPFPLTRSIRKKDDQYYDKYRLTPKAFLSLATGQRLWGSRFGQITSVRIPAPPELKVSDSDRYVQQLTRRLLDQIRQSETTLGFDFRPVKQQALASSRGATRFDTLFLGLGTFIVAAALMLVALLFRLGIEQRADQIGLLLATGVGRRRTVRLLLGEGTVVAALGGLLGVGAAIGYAELMLAGLRSGWWGDYTTPLLKFHGSWPSLVLGFGLGLLVSVLTVAWSVRQLGQLSVVQLLAGRAEPPRELVPRRHTRLVVFAATALVLSTLLLVAATRLGGEAQAGAFVGGGALMLTALLVLVWNKLRSGADAGSASALSVARLATRSAGRNPTRSTATIGLMSCASFLIVALSSFRLAPQQAGTGGFDLVGESSAAIFADFSTETGRDDALGDQAELLRDTVVFSLRARAGEDASCVNLYKASQPRVLGVPHAMIQHFDRPEVPSFSWAGSAARSEVEHRNPWHLLEKPLPDGEVPVVIDKSTAVYGLWLHGRIGERFQVQYDPETTIRFRIVGLLSYSLLQGNLLIGERQFQQHFRDEPGYRYFLIQCPPGQADRVAGVLEDALADQGLDATSAPELLHSLLSVQNTFLSTFQSLGALGLLLGTFGLATVQLRNMLQRRPELALLRAAGFRWRRLAWMVMLESLVLLFGGLGIGVAAALWSVLPHMVFGAASIPFRDLAVMLTIVLVVGLFTSLVAVRWALRAPLLPALRGE